MRRMIAVFGPTAVGKSRFCLELAQAIGGEIVNADAVQLYRGFDLGAAKPAAAERCQVAHHLLDIADPGMDVTVASYQLLAADAIREIRRRGAVPIISGGSGLYLRAALGEWDAFGLPPDPALRRWAEQAPTEAVRERALAVDPEGAARLSPSDRPRLLRVIERAAERARAGQGFPGPGGVLKVGLHLPRPILYRRIDERAKAMWPHLLRETRDLLARGPAAAQMAARTIGYREALAFLQGDVGEEEALRAVQQSTRRFAKRQVTWWRRERDTIWLRPEEGLRQLLPSLSEP